MSLFDVLDRDGFLRAIGQGPLEGPGDRNDGPPRQVPVGPESATLLMYRTSANPRYISFGRCLNMTSVQKFPYGHQGALLISAYLIIIAIFVPTLIYLTSHEWMAALIVGCVVFLFDLVFGISQFFTSHRVEDGEVVLRQSWYFKHRFKVADIVLVQKVQHGPEGMGIPFRGRGHPLRPRDKEGPDLPGAQAG